MDKEGERSPPPAVSSRLLPDDALWDSCFDPMWQRLKASMRLHYPGINDADAEDLAGETLAKIVEYFDFDSLGDLQLQEREKRLWAYIRSIRRGVASDFFASRNPEVPLPIEIVDSSEEVAQLVPRHATVVRKALLHLTSGTGYS